MSLSSSRFNPFLYLANGRTRRGRPLLLGTNTLLTDGSERLSPNARLVFMVKPGGSYFLRATTTSPGEQGVYTIRYRVFRSASPSFNFFYGSGLVDAAAALSSATGRPVPASSVGLGGEDWGRDLIKAPAVWAEGITGQGVTVAVIDTGVDLNHPELRANLWVNSDEIPGNGIDDDRNGLIDDYQGWDFASNDNDPSDTDGHGTHVAGTIAAARDGVGVTGVAPNAQIMPIRVLSAQPSTTDPTGNIALIRGIDYAINNGAKVINLSLSKGYRYDFEFGAALQRANQAGVVVVIASGNEREDEGAIQPSELGYRAMVNNLGIAVGAVDRDTQMALFSNPAGRRPGHFVVAPGMAILSSVPGGQYATYSGTSMATPHVAGLAALLLSANPSLTPAQIYSILTQTANRQVGVRP
ncbi:MAG: S8 family peptidase [Elainella sp.]